MLSCLQQVLQIVQIVQHLQALQMLQRPWILAFVSRWILLLRRGLFGPRADLCFVDTMLSIL